MAIDPENPHAGQGPVLLDLDDAHGALIVLMPADLVGAEVELHALDPAVAHDHHHHASGGAHDHPTDARRGHGHRHHADHEPHAPHVAVHPRPTPRGDDVPSAVFPCLAPGRYACSLLGGHDRPLVVTVAPGGVTFADWPATGQQS